MDITRRCDYACRMLRAAYGGRGKYVSVSDVADREDVPYAFARSIQHDLTKAGILKTARGARGGLALASDPADVSLLDILEALQGPVSISACVVDPEYCDRRTGCAYNKVWQGADRLLAEYFSGISLKDVFEMDVACGQGESEADDSHAGALPDSRADISCGLHAGGFSGALSAHAAKGSVDARD